MIYEFRIAVRDIGVPIWRDIQVNSDETFYDFNSIIQAAFSWSSFFEHRFEITRSGGTDLLPIIIEETPLDTLEDYTDESDLREYSDEEREDVDEIEEMTTTIMMKTTARKMKTKRCKNFSQISMMRRPTSISRMPSLKWISTSRRWLCREKIVAIRFA